MTLPSSLAHKLSSNAYAYAYACVASEDRALDMHYSMGKTGIRTKSEIRKPETAIRNLGALSIRPKISGLGSEWNRFSGF